MAQEYKFVFTADEAASEGVTKPERLLTLITKVMSLALAPISKYKVGAVGLASSGQVYIGVNVNFPGLPLHHSIHATQFLVTNLALNSEEGLRELAVPVSPDGTEFLLDRSNAPDILITNGEGSFSSLERLLPYSIFPTGPSLLHERDNCLILFRSLREMGSDFSNLKEKALAAANKSFSPYTNSPSGVALQDDDGNLYRGWYIESVASIHSLGPVQAALVDFVARGRGKGFDKIVRAVLVEKKDAKVSQESTAKMLLDTIADPNCDFKVFYCDVNALKN